MLPPDFLHTGGAAVLTLIVADGLLCSAGTVTCALQRPGPSPHWLGIREVVHTPTVASFTAHYIAIILVIH
ncbi:hypothetical protein [Streptomyces sp. NPDC058665]|uniref:hypothetical protein n=1 Tax=Streptomyces sp. NPDC058665 TaxID=3346586 RepID=UPI003662A7DC